jgi:hypothetical protein
MSVTPGSCFKPPRQNWPSPASAELHRGTAVASPVNRGVPISMAISPEVTPTRIEMRQVPLTPTLSPLGGGEGGCPAMLGFPPRPLRMGEGWGEGGRAAVVTKCTPARNT